LDRNQPQAQKTQGVLDVGKYFAKHHRNCP
jgi:hypothetical protein